MPNRPKGWKRAIPEKLRLQVWTARNGLSHVTGAFVRFQDCDIDHVPAAAHRPWDDVAGDTVPPQLDPAYLYVIERGPVHREKTHGPQLPGKRMLRASGDNHVSSKLKRLDRKNGHVEDKPARWPKRKIPNRGFPKRRK